MEIHHNDIATGRGQIPDEDIWDWQKALEGFGLSWQEIHSILYPNNQQYRNAIDEFVNIQKIEAIKHIFFKKNNRLPNTEEVAHILRLIDLYYKNNPETK